MRAPPRNAPASLFTEHLLYARYVVAGDAEHPKVRSEFCSEIVGSHRKLLSSKESIGRLLQAPRISMTVTRTGRRSFKRHLEGRTIGWAGTCGLQWRELRQRK